MEAPLQPAESYVERLWNELADLEQYVPQAGAVVLVNTRSAFAKAMVLAAGNWLERRTLQALLNFTKSTSSKETVVFLVKRRVFDRQFHTLFDWKSGKVNSFLGNFGPDFKGKYQEVAKESEEVLRASLDFMELVAERNGLAHDGRINEEAQFTPAQVRMKFYNASSWVSWVGQFLTEGRPSSWTPPSAPTPPECSLGVEGLETGNASEPNGERAEPQS